MIWRRVGYLAVVLLFLACAASALVPDYTPVNSNHAAEWYVANGVDSGTITLRIFIHSVPISGSQITFSVNNSQLASVNPVTTTTVNGTATTTFSGKKTSGDVLVTAAIQYKINETNSSEPIKTLYTNLTEHIDHDTPYRISVYTYSNEMTVGSTNQFQLSFLDRWGNPIDNRHIAEQVQLTVSEPPPQNGGFLYNSVFVNQTVLSVDKYGNITATIKMNSLEGWNVVMVHPLMTTPGGLQAIPDKLLMINGIPAKPYSIASIIDPPSGETYADGQSQFHISYYIIDQYGNPVQNRSVQITTSVFGEDKIIGTDTDGLAMMMYGPKTTIGVVWINATALDNSSVKFNQQVRFLSQEPVDMLVTASPQTMPSIDASPGSSAVILAKVTDILGNPVENETITFAFDSLRYDTTNASSAATSAPSLSAGNALTDVDGNAIIQFTPGGFISNTSARNYTQSATGRCSVTATWEGVSHSVPLVWKNYPYLSVFVQTNTSTVTVNDTVLVDVMLKGDGWALQPNPIDVVLVIDRSGSMADSSGSNYPNNNTAMPKIVAAQNAGKTFVSKMVSARDRIGIVSYAGSTAGTGTRTDITLGSNFNSVNSSINSLQALGATETRSALKQAIDLIISKPNSNPNAVKAIILLTDGNWNWNGTPLGHGTGWPVNASHTFSGNNIELNDYLWYDGLGGTLTYNKCTNGETTNQNMTNYAKNNGIRLYMISFGSGLDSNAVAAMNTMASGTGGFYQNAPAGGDLAAIYTRIAGDLQTAAGVNTNMVERYDQVEVNYVTESNSGNTTSLQYVPSTLITSYWTNGTTLSGYPSTINQMNNWNGNPRQLIFAAGTIYLNQIWEAKYMLKVIALGNINIFGPNSVISFNNGTQTLNLPKTYVSSIENMTNTNVTTYILTYTNVSQSASSSSNPGAENQYITFNITSTYTGLMNVTEDYYIITYDQQKHYISSRTLTPSEANRFRTFTIAIADLPAGWVSFLPVMNVQDAPGPQVPPVQSIVHLSNPGKVYINLT